MERKIIAFLTISLILVSATGSLFIVHVEPAEAEGRRNLGRIPSRGDIGTDLQDENAKLEVERVQRRGNRSETITGHSDESAGAKDWHVFAGVDRDVTRLVVGVDSKKPTSLLGLERVGAAYQAKVVNSVLARGLIQALVFELPVSSVAGFEQNVNAAGLSTYIEPDAEIQAQLIPNDPYWSSQWGPKTIEADLAWDTTVGDSSVLVAIVDTGIFYNHSDLASAYVPLGYDWMNRDTDPLDDNGHGTHCAGIVAATINNGKGIAGLAQVRVMAEKVLNSWGGGSADTVASGIIHATDCGANIISMSLGTYADSELLHEAVRYAHAAGVLIVAAAGNDDTQTKMYPAGYPEVIAVAATAQSDTKAQFSNWGEWIELAAPGVDILSTVLSGYESHSGTSMACPHVAGVAALVWSERPDVDANWVRICLRVSADDLGGVGFDTSYGYGRVNARRAVELTLATHELIALDLTTPSYLEPGVSGTINATILNFGQDEADVTVQLLANGSLSDVSTIGFVPSGNSVTVSFEWSSADEGLLNITLRVVPIPGEMDLGNNMLWRCIFVGFPVKAAVLHSAGNIVSEIIMNWQALSSEWYLFGATMINTDYTTLNKDGITYEDIAATEADVLIISCAYDRYYGWDFTDSEISAIKRYIEEGHGLIATAGTLFDQVPNNNRKLAPLFGLDSSVRWQIAPTDLTHILNASHPLFRGIPDPLVFPTVGTALPSDGGWDSNELEGGQYLATGHYLENAIVEYRGLLYISPWMEVIPPYYRHHLQLLYNAITWSRFRRPAHELAASVESPGYVHFGESALLNATVTNDGLSSETDVEMYLLINGTVVKSIAIPDLLNATSYTMTYNWTPASEGTYNVTVCVPSVPDEDYVDNNMETKVVRVRTFTSLVVFEEAHAPAYTIGSNPAADVAGGYSEFASCLVNSGYMVSTIDYGAVIDSNTLSAVDVLIITAPSDSYSSNELDAIEEWVKQGGNLLLISDWDSYGLQAGIIASRFDFTLRKDMICDTDDNSGYASAPYYHDANLISHAVTAGVTRVEMYAGDGITSAAHDATPLIVTDSDGTAYWFGDWSPARAIPVMAALEGGTIDFGRLIVIGDSNVWDSAHDADGDGSLDFHDSDNEILALNCVGWLSIRQQHDISVQLHVPDPIALGNAALINATVRNRGISNETDVELQLIINGSIADSVIVPELQAGTFHTLAYTWIPSEGGADFNLTAYASPVQGENATLNNNATRIVHIWLYTRKVLPAQWIGDGSGMDWHGDDLSWAYTLPFDFPFFGAYYRTIYVSSNGFATFNRPEISPGNSIPELACRTALAPAWDDWRTTDPFDIHTWQNLTHVGIRWHAQTYISGYAASFEVILGADGVIQFDYGFCDGPVSATIGISNGVGEIYAEDATDLNTIGTIIFVPSIPEHDLAVFLRTLDRLLPGESEMLNATVMNRGLNNETDVQLQLMINGSEVDSITVPELHVGEASTLNYLWTPAVEGTYNITAVTSLLPSEDLTTNNVAKKLVQVREPAVHDVAVNRVDVSSAEVCQGRIVEANVTVANIGSTAEAFDVTLYCNATVIGTQHVPSLAPNATLVLSFTWDTAGVPCCHRYAIRAVASAVPGEVNTSNNEFSGGLVNVKMVGDINGDEIVDIYDVVEATRAYDSRPGDANWNPDADLAPQFGLINIFDITTLIFHY